MPWVLPFKTVNVRESFDSASSAHQTPGAWGAQSIRGSSDSLPAYMPSHHHLDADVADIDFSRSPPYKNAQARGGVPQSFDRGNSKPQYRVGRSVRPGVEYSVGASDAALLARDTRNAHTHVHTLERAAGGEGGSGGVVATSRSHKIMFGGAEEPSPMREGINLLAGPEPPSALEGMGDIFGGSRDWYGQRGSQPGQQQPRQPTSTTVRSCAVIQYDNNGTVVEYEGRVRGGTGAPVARLDVFTGTPGGGEAGASSPPTKRCIPCQPAGA